jgi:hypothetical protein
MELIPIATLVVTAVTLVIVVLNYFEDRRMRPSDIERQIRERFQSTLSYKDFKMGLGAVRVTADNGTLRKRLENLYRTYPHGTTQVEVTFADSRLFRRASMDDDVFERFCERIGVEAEQAKVETHGQRQEVLIVDIKTTDPDDAYTFLQYLPMAVRGEWSFS